MGDGRSKKLIGWMLQAFLLAMLLHAHPASEGALQAQLQAPGSACPVCAALQGGAETPEPRITLTPLPETELIPLGRDIAPEFTRIPATLSLRGPPSQA